MAEKLFIGFLICCCVIDVASGEYCTKYNSDSFFDDSIYCESSCCGDLYNRYCCGSNVGLIVGILFGVVGLITIVTVIAVLCCCCQRSRSQQGQVIRPTCTVTTARVYGVQSTPMTGYGQTGYTNAAFPQQLQATNVAGNGGQTLQSPPPLTTVNT